MDRFRICPLPRSVPLQRHFDETTLLPMLIISAMTISMIASNRTCFPSDATSEWDDSCFATTASAAMVKRKKVNYSAVFDRRPQN
ncbi:hypothetical protein M514_04133 [Trichuris suis]|uniref:Uncharacterized protein n=1 Tax=Trichuris suis TaxID=68888 RepID=A0A085NG32_9BILA|nr:hypothetical protein M513_04133 [Trichuris suis]KFD68428.1 hypothetical protein M514_04133 [Trichuris suis]